MKDDRLYLIHIGECLDRIEQYSRGGEADFKASTLIQDAVLRNLQTLAESSQRISEQLKTSHPDVPWRDIAASAMCSYTNISVLTSTTCGA